VETAGFMATHNEEIDLLAWIGGERAEVQVHVRQSLEIDRQGVRRVCPELLIICCVRLQARNRHAICEQVLRTGSKLT
jgi:hypothetical protein